MQKEPLWSGLVSFVHTRVITYTLLNCHQEQPRFDYERTVSQYS